LHYAAKADDAAGVRLLLAHGARVLDGTREGAVAAYVAAREGADAALHALLETAAEGAVAQLRSRTHTGRGLLHTAAAGAHASTVRALLAHAARLGVRAELLAARDHSGLTALHDAAGAGALDAARELADQGLRPWQATDAGRPPLAWSPAPDRPVPPLSGVPFDVAGRLPLHTAVLADQAAFVDWLLGEAGAGLPRAALARVPDAEGAAPVYGAAARGAIDMVRRLLSAGASGAAASPRRTALHCAAERWATPLVRLLVDEGGADPRARDAAGATPWESAQRVQAARAAGARASHVPWFGHSAAPATADEIAALRAALREVHVATDDDDAAR
jgi:ankyrin repeat protein